MREYAARSGRMRLAVANTRAKRAASLRGRFGAVVLRDARHEHLATPIVNTVMVVLSRRQRQNREHAAWREPLP